MTEKKKAIVLGYVLVAVTAVSGICLTPILLKNLGQNEYGLYKLAVSYISLISVLDFGLGGTITRYIVKYNTENTKEKKQEFLSTSFIVYSILAIIVFGFGIVLGMILPKTILSLLPGQSSVFRELMFILALRTSIMLFNHAFNGLFVAYEYFVLVKTLSLLQIVMKIILLIIILPIQKSPITVVIIDLLLAQLQLVINIIMKRKYGLDKITFKKWNRELFREIVMFTSAIFLATIINQFNSNVDNIVLGTYTSTIYVGLYASVMQIYTIYASLSTAIQDVYLPQISKKVFQNKSNDEVTLELIKPSRMQLIVLILAFTGFVLFGYEFLDIWIGTNYNPQLIAQAYLIGIIVMGTATWQLCQNSTTAVLKAKNLLKGKVLLTGLSTVINIIITMMLVPKYGMLGASVGTAISMILGYGVATNIYYHKIVKLNLKIYYSKLLNKLWYSFGIAVVLGAYIRKLPIEGISGLGVKIVIYIIVYTLVIYMFGLECDEKWKTKFRRKDIKRR